jgi:hypothetical protein
VKDLLPTFVFRRLNKIYEYEMLLLKGLLAEMTLQLASCGGRYLMLTHDQNSRLLLYNLRNGTEDKAINNVLFPCLYTYIYYSSPNVDDVLQPTPILLATNIKQCFRCGGVFKLG